MKTTQLWNHATSQGCKNRILKEGFNLKNCDGGMWGKGVYFSSSDEDALKYGNHLLLAQIPSHCIAKFQYRELTTFIPDLLIEEEAGDPLLKEIVTKNLNKQTAAITYDDGVTHLVVYELNCIENIQEQFPN